MNKLNSPTHKLVLIGERPLYFFQAYYGTIAWLDCKFSSDIVWFSKNHNVQFYFEEKDITSQRRMWRKVISEPNFFKTLINKFTIRKNHLVNFFKRLNIHNLSNKKLFKAYEKWLQFYQYYQGEGNPYTRLVDRYGMQVLRDELKKQKVIDIESAVTILTAPNQESYLAKEERLFWSGVVIIKSPKQLNRFLNQHLEHYAWVGRSYMEEPALTIQQLRNRLKKVSSKNRPTKLTHLTEILKHNLLLRKQLIKKYSLNKKIIQYADILQNAAFFKDFIRGLLAEVYYYSDKVFDELEKRTNLSREQIKSLTYEEFNDVFLKKKIPNFKLIKERLNGIYLVLPNDSISAKVIYGKPASSFENKYLLDKSLLYVKEFKGRAVSNGIVKGKVRVVYKWSEMEDFKKGEVLVVNNTNPSFVPYLHKAVAIIAAEGGVTVHAAIVAREMKIPCVIGISNVTRLLKTGQMIEVDANKGIVRKLTR